jgi:hypothetical protein
MGVVRTTFAMVAASLVRRKQVLARGMEDPYPEKALMLPFGRGSKTSGNSGFSTVSVPPITLRVALMDMP